MTFTYSQFLPTLNPIEEVRWIIVNKLSFDICISYVYAIRRKHNDQGNLQEEEFIWAKWFQRGRSPS